MAAAEVVCEWSDSFRLTNWALYLVLQTFWIDPGSDKPHPAPDVETRRLISLLRAVKRGAVIHQRVLLPILLRVYGIFSISSVTAANRPVALCLVSFMHHCLVTIRQMHFKGPATKTEAACEVRELLVRNQLRKRRKHWLINSLR